MLNIREDILKEPIHQIIYLDDDKKRKELIEAIEKEDPKNIIILDEIGSKPFQLHENCKKDVLTTLNRQFLYFSIIYKIIEKAEELDCNINNIDILIEMVNMMYLSNDTKYLKNLSELKNHLYIGKETYKMGIEEYSITGNVKFDFERLLIPKVDIINVSTKAKRLINEISNMLILFNHEKEISLSATETVNDLIFTKINRNFSVKLFTDADSWKTFTTDTGQVLSEHSDYNLVDLNGVSLIKN